MRSGWPAVLCLLALSCSSPAPRPPAATVPGEWLPFEGTWTATGSRQTVYALVFLGLGTPWLLFIGR